MSLWGRVFAAIYDPLLAKTERRGFADRRASTVGQAQGRVLELGAGTGLNLSHYRTAEVSELFLTEPEEPMARRLERRASAAGLGASIVRAPAEQLPFPDEHFDTVVSTLVLCTVGDLAASLAEVRRVLRPGGRLLFAEHVRSEDPKVARLQDRVHPLWVRFGHGCHCNRATLPAIESAGFTVEAVEHSKLPAAPPFVRPLIVGTAVR